MPRRRIVLLGDSILDNAPYTGGDPDTPAHLRRLLGADYEIESRARDGARMVDVDEQLAGLEGRVDVAVLSVGGNDVTPHIGVLRRESSNSEDVIGDLVAIADEFEGAYTVAAQRVAACAERTVLCTIYEARLDPPSLARLARAPIALLNDRIRTIGARMGADVLDLRTVCVEDDDFVLQIEPSAKGAKEIAEAVAALVTDDGSLRSSRGFVRT